LFENSVNKPAVSHHSPSHSNSSNGSMNMNATDYRYGERIRFQVAIPDNFDETAVLAGKI
jgi:hypothetical protein